MEFSLYEGIKYFIKNGRDKLPKKIESDTKLAKQIRNMSHLYTIKDDGLLYFGPRQDREVVREDEFEEVMAEAHDNGGHFGETQTYEKLKPDFYWPNMIEHIHRYVSSCDVCQKRSTRTVPHEPLHPIKVNRPFQMIGVDCVGPLPETQRKNKYIIVMTDYFTKWPEAEAVQNIQASTIADFIYRTIYCRHGAPEKIVTDQGSSFVNYLVTALLEVIGTRHTLTTSYHPQTNGLTEKFNGTLCNTIAKLMLTKGDTWDHWIDTALLKYRTTPHSTTKHRPDMMLYGRPMQTPFTIERRLKKNEEPIEITYDQHEELITNTLNKVHTEARQNIDNAQERQKKQYDKRVKPLTYKVGQKVLLHNERKKDKFDQNWIGPYYIQSTYDNGTYALSDIESGRIVELSVNSKRLKEYHEKPAYEPKAVVIQDEQRIKELEERTNVIKRRTVKPTGEIIRQEAEEEYNQMKKIEQQIKERQEKIRKNKQLLEENRMRELARESQRKNDERINQTLRKQLPQRLITRKDREALLIKQLNN